MKKKKDEIRSILSTGNIEKAFKKLMNIYDSKELITIQSRYNRNEKNYQLAIIDIESYQNEINRITLSLLSFIENDGLIKNNEIPSGIIPINKNSYKSKEELLIQVNRKIAYAKHHLEQSQIISKGYEIIPGRNKKLFVKEKKIASYKLINFSKDFNYKFLTEDFYNFQISFIHHSGNYNDSDKSKEIKDLAINDFLIEFNLEQIDTDITLDKIYFGALEDFTLLFPEYEYCAVLMLLGGYKRSISRRINPSTINQEKAVKNVDMNHWKLKISFKSKVRAEEFINYLNLFLLKCEELKNQR